MAKLVVVLLVCFLASALTACSAYRPLPSETQAALPADKTDSTTAASKTSFFSSASATPATESGVVEQDEGRTETESGETFNDVAPPCTEEDFKDSNIDGDKRCHRRLEDDSSFAMLDYGGTGHSNPNPKYP